MVSNTNDLLYNFEYFGTWYLPDQDVNDGVEGILKYDSDKGANLQLIGSFTDPFEKLQDIREISEPRIILGFTSCGKKITLHQCREIPGTIKIPGFAVQSFRVGHVFVGTEFKKEEDIKFRHVCIKYSHIDEWLGMSGISLDYDDGFITKYKCPGEIKLLDKDDLRISIFFWPSSKYLESLTALYRNSYIRRVPKLEPWAWISIELNEPKRFTEILQLVTHIRNALSFCNPRKSLFN
jgi:hypothetical protein